MKKFIMIVCISFIIEAFLIFIPKTDKIQESDFIKTKLNEVMKTYMILGLPNYESISRPIFSRGYTNASHTGYQILEFVSKENFTSIKREILCNNACYGVVEQENYFEGNFGNTKVTIKKNNNFYSYSIWPYDEETGGDI